MKEWIMIKDLINVGGLPGTTQGITLRAKKENWQRRRVEGKKGNVFEYYVGDMPKEVQQSLGFTQTKEQQIEYVNLLSDCCDIPRYPVHASAGLGFINDDHCEPEDFFKLPLKLLRDKGLHRKDLLFIQARGDSMEPTIRNNDDLLVDKSRQTLQDGQIYVLRVGEEILVKRVQRLVNGFRLISDNKELYEAVDVMLNEDSVQVIGQVVSITSWKWLV